MPAPKGNQFWKARSSSGRNPLFENPNELKQACEEYFDWVEENPVEEHKVFHCSGKITEATLKKTRAMTIGGLCNFLDIHFSTWADYRNKDDFTEVCERVEGIIKQQKFEGAAANVLNPSIIARDLGLADKKEESRDIKVIEIPSSFPAEPDFSGMSDDENRAIAGGFCANKGEKNE